MIINFILNYETTIVACIKKNRSRLSEKPLFR